MRHTARSLLRIMLTDLAECTVSAMSMLLFCKSLTTLQGSMANVLLMTARTLFRLTRNTQHRISNAGLF